MFGSFDASFDSRGDILVLTPPPPAAAAAAAVGELPLRALLRGLDVLLPKLAAVAMDDLMLLKVADAAADLRGELPTLLLKLAAILLDAGTAGLPPKVATVRVGLPGGIGIRVPPSSGLSLPLLQREKLRCADSTAEPVAAVSSTGDEGGSSASARRAARTMGSCAAALLAACSWLMWLNIS
jgi:hypothetical protein